MKHKEPHTQRMVLTPEHEHEETGKDKTLSSKDVCRILDSCRSNGVTSLTLGDLKVELGLTHEQTQFKQWNVSMATAFPKQFATAMPEAVEERAFGEAELEQKQLELDEALISNPSLYESLIASEDVDG